MPILRTRRLVLMPLSRAMVEARVQVDEDFSLHVVPVGVVRFPSSWPGDPVAGFPGLLGSGAAEFDGTWVAIDTATLEAVGQLGTVGDILPSSEIQEIGYGFGVHSRGFATEAVDAVVTHLLNFRQTVSAKTAVWNRASERVLEKNGFVRVGTGWDDDDGDLVLWERS